MPEAEVGSTASNYEILARLATGGMAEIFLARAASTAGVERYVVLKRVLRERASDSNFVQMFVDEARLAAQLQHPNIAQVYDIGKLGESYFFTMEYVHGETVRALLHRSHGLQRSIPIAAALTIAAGAAAGLHHAHERIGIDGKPLGIVHRDVSPSNLMVSYDGHVKLVDFGVAKATHQSQETRSGAVKGKIAYLSPEQCRGRAVDRRSDLFSLGIVLWELLTVERLFRHPSDFETMAAIVNDPAPPPSSRRPEIPPELDALVLKLLAKAPEDRFQTGDEVLDAIEQLAASTQTTLSAAALGRFIKELFGQRPEPWVELRALEAHQGPVTVTSESVPAELERASTFGPNDPRATVQLRSGHEALDRVPTSPMANIDAATPLGMNTVMAPAPPPPATMPSPFAPSSSNPFSMSSAHRINPLPGTGSVAGYPSSSPARRFRRVVLVLAPAIIVGIVLGIMFAVAHNKQRADAGGGSAIAMTLVDATAQVAPVVPLDPAAGGAGVAIDAALAAASDAAPPVDSAPVHDAGGVDAQPKKPSDDVTYATCAAAGVLAANPVTCTIAACKAKDLTRAKKWFATVPGGRRSTVTAACPALAPPKHDDAEDCKHNPLACQH